MSLFTNITHTQFHKRDITPSLFTFTNTIDCHHTNMLDEIRTLIRAHEAARSSGRAATRVSDFHTGVEHHHNPHRASGSGVSTVSKPSGPGTINTPTPRETLDYLISVSTQDL
eukprot:2502232-Pleurochrysis_carterae.AAC.1